MPIKAYLFLNLELVNSSRSKLHPAIANKPGESLLTNLQAKKKKQVISLYKLEKWLRSRSLPKGIFHNTVALIMARAEYVCPGNPGDCGPQLKHFGF